MGASLTMVDRHYGHLARDAASTRSASSTASTRRRWTFVDARWTLKLENAADADN